MSTLSTNDLLAYLSEPAATTNAAAIDPAPYRDAAAVLAAIERPGELRPVGDAPRADASVLLAADLIPATGRKFQGQVMLAPDVRYHAIVRLAERGQLQAALDANPDERGEGRKGPVQAQLERYLLGTAQPLEQQTLDDLDASRQVAVWLRDAVPGVPGPAAVEARSAYLRLLAPFEAIAGDGVFRGRKRELDELREFVGVLAPESLLRRLRASTLKWLQPKARPALTLHGPGGVGKSALIARFMLEHTRLPDGGRLPFAYLDFDRVALDVADPYGLVTEMIRQLAVQFPLERIERLRTFIQQRSETLGTDAASRYEAAQSVLAEVLGVMSGELGPRPYVVVLDTFEEVQYRGEGRAFPLWELLDRLQQRWPFLRVIVSGRAPVETLRLGGQAPRSMQLGDLDAEAAVAFLKSQGVADPALAARLVRQYGGVPLSLKLVASLLARDPGALSSGDAPGRGGLLARVGNEVVQGQLYERVLGHIHDERVRRLAHPGLVLRRVTPDVILQVLDGPCELGVTTLDVATELFDALRRETSLMSVDDADGSLVHRSDLRRVMLRLLMASEPARVAQIRRVATGYYDTMGGRRGVAEATYHRLHLGEFVGEETFRDPEVRSSIQASVMELPPAVQRRLATLGFTVADVVLQEASRDELEQAVAAHVEEYLPNGPAAMAEAMRILDSTSISPDHASPLFRAWARATLQAGDRTAAAGWIERGLEQAGLANETGLALALLQERAWLEHGTSQRASPATLRALADTASRHADGRALLLSQMLAFDPAGAAAAPELKALTAAVERASPEDAWALAPALQGGVTASLERRDPAFLSAVQGRALDVSGPFRAATFADPATQERLDSILDPSAEPVEFGRAFQALVEAWPYSILFVQPPYGRRGSKLYESAS